ncbi:hypothetical protein QN386_22185 [Pseudomonas sp. CCI3.2]|uniref:hypothetical protein n=1 Tax=unclassified Pseudomonas TaxID=196821 RepID=UPI002B225F10|nr:MULTISPECIES: hypothetical protein [unclassified Pseudomonas]MEB0078006.1 hypothetical protein [Pseudomonas sp. MH10out]MEB0104013.1 hypothetical protein [Pseudomonas sp. CCI3.2]MEB0133583.1 hypothetical protein [Pseudomonas sp. CCI2.4]MEB0167951.1 hypothetical protein [Pseudomonas sp. CCC4.4]
MNKWIFLSLLVSAGAAASGADTTSCSVVVCSPGDKAVTYATKSDFYYACPTRELADYTNTVAGLSVMTYQISGKLPNISPETGEPQYQGDSKLLLDSLRKKSGVRTFDEALSACMQGKGKLKVTIMNIEDNEGSVWVSQENKIQFWLPKSFLIKR